MNIKKRIVLMRSGSANFGLASVNDIFNQKSLPEVQLFSTIFIIQRLLKIQKQQLSYLI